MKTIKVFEWYPESLDNGAMCITGNILELGILKSFTIYPLSNNIVTIPVSSDIDSEESFNLYAVVLDNIKYLLQEPSLIFTGKLKYANIELDYYMKLLNSVITFEKYKHI